MKSALKLLVILLLALETGYTTAATTVPFDPSPHAIDIPAWFKPSFLDFRDDIEEAARHSKRVMIYFGQDGCPYCRELMRVNFSQKDLVDKARRHFDAISLNVWGDREVIWLDGRRYTEKSLAALLKVQFTPTLVFLDEGGNVALRLNGYYPPHKLAVALDYGAGNHAARGSFAAFLAQHAREPSSGKLHDEPFLLRPPYDFHARKRGKPLAVIFEQQDCAACDELHGSGFRDKAVRAALAKLDVARLVLFGRTPVVTPAGLSTTDGDWARDLGVTYTPSIVFFDAAGAEVFRIEGYVRPFHLASGLDYVASGAYRKEPSFQRFIQARAARLRAAGVGVEIW